MLNVYSGGFSMKEQLKITDQKIVKSCFVQREIEYVWHLWTTKEGIQSFLGIDSWIELQPFGRYELYFDQDAQIGQRGSETCQVLSFIKDEFLSFTWNAPPSLPEVRNHTYKTWVVVNFNRISDKQTLVKLTHLGWPSGSSWDEAYRYFDKAWGYVLNRLEKM